MDLRDRYGVHVVDGIAGETILLDAPDVRQDPSPVVGDAARKAFDDLDHGARGCRSVTATIRVGHVVRT